jgi:hypothetical protein
MAEAKIVCFWTFFSNYRWTTLYARDRDQKIRLAYNEFAYKKTKDTHNEVGDLFLKKQLIFNRTYANLQIKRPHTMRSACSMFL